MNGRRRSDWILVAVVLIAIALAIVNWRWQQEPAAADWVIRVVPFVVAVLLAVLYIFVAAGSPAEMQVHEQRKRRHPLWYLMVGLAVLGLLATLVLAVIWMFQVASQR